MQSPKETATALFYVMQSSVSELCSGASGVRGAEAVVARTRMVVGSPSHDCNLSTAEHSLDSWVLCSRSLRIDCICLLFRPHSASWENMIDPLVTEVSFLARSSEEEVSDQTTHRSPPKLPKTCLDVRRPESGLTVFSVTSDGHHH